MMKSTHSYFRSSGYQTNAMIDTDSGNQLDIASLPPFLRTLLVMDGTVTKALESWFWEPVNIVPLSNQQQDNSQNLQREVLLRGEKSSNIFACARSQVSLESLPNDMAKALSEGTMGIGEILREKGLETYRELFNINYLKGISKDDSLLGNLAETDIVSRSYKIWVNQKSAITVTEYFPLQLYSQSSSNANLIGK